MTDSQLTTFSLGIPAPGQTQPAYMYTLRLGAADPKVDNYVVYGENGSYTMAPTPTGDDPRANEGIVLYSYDNFTVYAPTSQFVSNITSNWSAESLSATVTNGLVSNASYSSKGLISTYASAAQMAINASDLVSFNGGNTMTVWAGNDASTGIGGLLWSNFGLTQNIFGGQVVNITAAGFGGGVMEVQGWGEAKLANSVQTAASSEITLAVSPLAAPSSTLVNVLKNAALYGTGLLAFGTAWEDIGVGVELDRIGAASSENYDRIKATMEGAFAASAALSTLIVVCQALGAIAGRVASAKVSAADIGTFPYLNLNLTGAYLRSGGAAISGLVALDGELTVACEPSYIEMTPVDLTISSDRIDVLSDGQITLVCGASTISLTSAGISMRGTSVMANGVDVTV